MKRLSYTIFVLLLAVALTGCASQEQSLPDLPPPTITTATWQLGNPYTVVITGEYFKLSSDNKKDVIVSINGRNWQAAKAITASSSTSYTADLPYGIDLPQVWVRVFGLNDEYSGPALIQGQR